MKTCKECGQELPERQLKYKVGDEVYIKVKITEVDPECSMGLDYKTEVQDVGCGYDTLWLAEEDLIPIPNNNTPQADEYGWITWDGKSSEAPVDSNFEVMLRDGRVLNGDIGGPHFEWNHIDNDYLDPGCDIVKYRHKGH